MTFGLANPLARSSLLKIRTFELSDYPRVKNLWTESGLDSVVGDSFEEIKRKISRDPELFLVAELDNVLVGTVLGAWDGRRGWIYHLGVLPTHQRSGIASKLVSEVETRMRSKGVLKVWTLVYNTNRNSLAFFRKNGYKHDEAMTVHGKILRED